MRMIRLAVSMFFVIALLSACSRQQPDPSSPAEDTRLRLEPQEVLISVNGNELTYAQAVRQVELRLGGPPPPGMDPARIEAVERRMVASVVDDFIRRELLLSEARRLSIEPAPEDVDFAVQTIHDNVREGAPPPSGLIYDGPDSLRREVQTGLQIEKLLAQELPPMPEPTDEDVDQFIADHNGSVIKPARAHVRHIFMAMSPDADDTEVVRVRTEMEAARARLLDGADFAQIASMISQDPAAANGGELGLLVQGRGEPVFEQAAFAQEPHEIGPVVRSPAGFHIIQIRDLVEAQPASREEIIDLLHRRNRSEALALYIRSLRKKADIKHSPAIRPLPEP